jgi:DNA-binding CsgD family transcriptional regulator
VSTEARARLGDVLAGPAGPRIGEADDLAERPASRAVDLVVLAEELYLRLFLLALLFALLSALLSIWFAASRSTSLAVTLPFSVAAAAFAAAGLRWPRALYGWLRYSEWRQLSPAIASAIAMLVTGPDSPLWWPALALVILLTSISSLRLSLVGGVMCAAGYVAGTAIGGAAIIRSGQAGILAGAVGFIAYTLVGAFVCEAFARFVLGLQQLERLQDTGDPRRRPRRVASVVLDDATAAPAAPAPAPGRTPAAPGRPRAAPERPPAAPATGAEPDGVTAADRPGPRRSPLTPRQLEVALLIRDGLNQAEAAASLGISRRQVERLLGEARTRAGAATTSHLMAMLVSGRLTS